MTDIDHVLETAGAARRLAPPPGDAGYRRYCTELADGLLRDWKLLLDANDEDVARATAAGLNAVLLDRLTLTERHRDVLVELAEQTAALLPELTRAGPPRQATRGMTVRRQPKPLGVVLMVYEARPTVTFEGALLPVAVGNVVLLKGGSETSATNAVFGRIAAQAVLAAGLPDGFVQVLADLDRAGVRALLKRHDRIDVVIPRGSPTLIDFCQLTSTMPVIASSGGVNHLYVDASADLAQAATIIMDSKLGEPTACNTLEMVLAHQEIAAALVEELVVAGRAFPLPWVLRVDPLLVDGGLGNGSQFGRIGTDRLELSILSKHDLGREFLDRSLGVLAVPDLAAAGEHISTHGSRHTEGIAARDPEAIAQFVSRVDAAALVVNGSLRLHDGPSMGFGPELSISTGRLHVRGPVGLSALMTYTWVIGGSGAVRGSAGPRS